MSVPLSNIADRRKMLAFLETLSFPSEAAQALIREFRAELAAYDRENRLIEDEPTEAIDTQI